jgi:uncharacterized protein
MLKVIEFSKHYQGDQRSEVSFEKDLDKNQADMALNETPFELSQFIHIIKNNKNYTLFSSTTATMIQGEGTWEYFLKNLITKKQINKNPHFLQTMKRLGFIIPKGRDEKAELRISMMSKRFRTDFLSLTILPTAFCNFKCTYCYEGSKKAPNQMKKNVQDEILHLLDGCSKKACGFHLDWFGGEPLLAPDVIENLSEKALTICEKNNIDFFSSITTNGYLLTKPIAKKLSKYNFRHAQITIDGQKKFHDKNRILLNGKGTYDRILQNLCAAVEYLPIIVRVNVDKENFLYIEEFLNDLKAHGLGKNITVYFSCIHDSCRNYDYDKTKAFTLLEFIKVRENLCEKLREFDFKQLNHRLFPKLMASNCIATKALHYIIGPKGELYKCTEDIGNDSETIGNIFDFTNEVISGIGSENRSYCSKFMNFDPTLNSVCGKCSFLPICMGGCAKKHIEKILPNNCFLKQGFKMMLQNEAKGSI